MLWFLEIFFPVKIGAQSAKHDHSIASISRKSPFLKKIGENVVDPSLEHRTPSCFHWHSSRNGVEKHLDDKIVGGRWPSPWMAVKPQPVFQEPLPTINHTRPYPPTHNQHTHVITRPLHIHCKYTSKKAYTWVYKKNTSAKTRKFFRYE
jgi:hypothetical protein